DLRIGNFAADIADRLDAFLLRHDDVGDDEIRLLAAENEEAAPSVFGADYLVALAFEDLHDGVADDHVVVDDEDFLHGSPCLRMRGGVGGQGMCATKRPGRRGGPRRYLGGKMLKAGLALAASSRQRALEYGAHPLNQLAFRQGTDLGRGDLAILEKH